MPAVVSTRVVSSPVVSARVVSSPVLSSSYYRYGYGYNYPYSYGYGYNYPYNYNYGYGYPLYNNVYSYPYSAYPAYSAPIYQTPIYQAPIYTAPATTIVVAPPTSTTTYGTCKATSGVGVTSNNCAPNKIAASTANNGCICVDQTTGLSGCGNVLNGVCK
jgi:hypothetical protein